MDLLKKANELISDFKSDRYIFGVGALDKIIDLKYLTKKSVVIIRGTFKDSEIYVNKIVHQLKQLDVAILKIIKGARPNSPKQDLIKIKEILDRYTPDLVISFGGGSTIDSTKAAIILTVLGGDIEKYFGSGIVSLELEEQQKKLIEHIAIQTLASSGAHLTKYSNITDTKTNQKKLIVDDAIIPNLSIFDYSITYNTPIELIIDGSLDAFSHSLEVLYDSHGKEYSKRAKDIAYTCISLVVENLKKVLDDRNDMKARYMLCLAADLGAYAIMIGGTNGAHLTSFSLVGLLSHGRACGIMNPYYTVFFAPAIEDEIRMVGSVFKEHGYIDKDLDSVTGNELGKAVAKGMISFLGTIGVPTRLKDVDGFNDSYINKAIEAAKDKKLEMKLKNMPITLNSDNVEKYLNMILLSAKTGDLNIIKTFDD